jgi:hypothetical protein
LFRLLLLPFHHLLGLLDLAVVPDTEVFKLNRCHQLFFPILFYVPSSEIYLSLEVCDLLVHLVPGPFQSNDVVLVPCDHVVIDQGLKPVVVVVCLSFIVDTQKDG